jgi:hypothetical protein
MSNSRVDKVTIFMSLVVIGSMFGATLYKSPRVEVLRELPTNPNAETKSQPSFPTETNKQEPSFDYSKLDLTKHYSLPVYIGKLTTDGIINSYGIQGDGDKVTNLEGKEYITLTINIPDKSVYQIFTTDGPEGNVYGYPNSIVILEKGKEYIVSKVVEQ